MSVLVLVPTALEAAGLDLPAETPSAICGVGPVAAALGTAAALATERPSSCLRVGLAGTRDPERAPLGQVVVGTSVRNEAVGCGQGSTFLARSVLEA